MSAEDRRKYAPDGKLYLSTCAIQKIISGASVENECIFQVNACRDVAGDKINWKQRGFCGRIKLSDGAFEYKHVFMPDHLHDQMKEDGLLGADPSMNAPIIVATGLTYRTDIQIASKVGDPKCPISIGSYRLLLNGVTKVGTPMEHSGDPKNYEGIEARPFNVFVDWKTDDDGAKRIKLDPDVVPTAVSTPAMASPPTRAPPTHPTSATRGPPLSKQPSSGQHATAISLISPYLPKWRICGKVISKEDMRMVKMKTGESKVFNFEITDKDAAIRVAAFGETAEKMFGLVQKGTSYYISGASVRPANKRYNSTGHDYELSLNNNSEVVPARDMDFEVKFKIKPVVLSELPKKNGELVDVVACVDSLGEVTDFTSRAGTAFTKREVVLVDQSGISVNMTLWGEQAREFSDSAVGQPIALKGVTVKEFNGGVSLSVGGSTQIKLTPDGIDGISNLISWYRNERSSVQVQTISNSGASSDGGLSRDLRLIGSLSALQLGRNDQNGQFVTVKARIASIKSDTAIYIGCAQEGCQKKVVPVEDEYRCDKCGVTTKNFKYNMMLQVEMMDVSGVIWGTLFAKAAEQLLGMDAETLGEMKNSNPQKYESVFDSVKWGAFTFRIRSKCETYNDEEKMKYTVFNVEKPNFDRLNPILDGVVAKLKELNA